MMKKFTIITSIYFMYEIIINGLIPYLRDDEEFSPLYVIINQIFDFMITLSLLVTFRPRHWPEYFSLGIMDSPLLGFGLARYDEGENRPQI
jgi:hypothetical protein